MKKLFVPYKIATLLREKGFNEPCIAVFFYHKAFKMCSAIWDNDIPCHYNVNNSHYYLEDKHGDLVTAPTLEQVFNWLEEKHQIFIDIETDCTTYPKFAYSINKFVGNPKDLAEKEWYWENPKPSNWFLYRTRNEALEEAIKFALTLI